MILWRRLPLYAKILCMLFANLAFVAIVFIIFLKVQLNFGLELLLNGRTGDRIRALSNVIGAELRDRPREDWDATLKRFSQAYELEFYIFRDPKRQLAGPEVALPPDIENRFRWRRLRLDNNRRPGSALTREEAAAMRERERRRTGPPPPMRSNPAFLAEMEGQYWIGVRLPVFNRELRHPATVMLLIRTPSLLSNGLFLDIRPWIIAGLLVLVLCVLFWWPFVHGITRYLRQMTQATESIATGSFSVNVSEKRADELGRLGRAINKMGRRLEGFVTGQKRFLGDIAHELCSPLARMQLGLGVLGQKTPKNQQTYVDDVRDEAENMSDMVNELLAFSKASIRPDSLELRPIPLRSVIDRVLTREGGESADLQLGVDQDLKVMADEGLLFRALANIVRNALRYAGASGPIHISTMEAGENLILSVADSGPGVSDEVADKLFDPFYRPEAARTAESGGAGLGLAIVKTCVESCQGTVTCRNRPEGGFQVDIQLRKANNVSS